MCMNLPMSHTLKLSWNAKARVLATGDYMQAVGKDTPKGKLPHWATLEFKSLHHNPNRIP